MLESIKKYFSLIKFSHTVFALPFAFIGFFLGIKAALISFTAEKLLLIVVCMVTARSAAMAFNRYIDRNFDVLNPRTAIREIPSGKITPRAALNFTIVCCFLFVVSAYFINQLCFYLSPVALLVILGYSLTKRFTALCHLVLGLGLALAPIGAYIAVTSQFAWLPIIFSVLVFFWVSGFDIIYALQDDVFDSGQNLKSIPVYLGRKNALLLSRFFHFLVSILIFVAFSLGHFNWLYLIGAFIFIALLIYQHTLVKTNDLSRVNLAFGTTNGIASVVFSTFVCLNIWLYQ
jgi:4-hydroxybenzoate polyprenyltransferase